MLAKTSRLQMSGGHRVQLDHGSVQEAYRRWAKIYDTVFGSVSLAGRRRAVETVNGLPGTRVLEAGVGTGLALPHYTPEKRVTGIDLSSDMLDLARRRVAEHGLGHVEGLREMDAEATDFRDAEFDIAVAMFVASVVPNPRRLLAEMKRVVRPGGHLVFVNHFAAKRGPRWWTERAMAPASRRLGWHPDFSIEELFAPDDLARISATPVAPLGIFTLVALPI